MKDIKNKFKKNNNNKKVDNIKNFIIKVAVLTIALISVMIMYVVLHFLSINDMDMGLLISIILALFSITISIFFYVKANETSYNFYLNSYEFMSEMSKTLITMKSDFSSKIIELEKNVKNNFEKKLKEVNNLKEKVDSKKRIEEIISNKIKENELAPEDKKKLQQELNKIKKEMKNLKSDLEEAKKEKEEILDSYNQLKESNTIESISSLNHYKPIEIDTKPYSFLDTLNSTTELNTDFMQDSYKEWFMQVGLDNVDYPMVKIDKYEKTHMDGIGYNLINFDLQLTTKGEEVYNKLINKPS